MAVVKLVSYNIQYGVGQDARRDLARVAREIAGADIIALQEVERRWRRGDGEDQPQRLAELLREYYWVYGPAMDLEPASRPDPVASGRERRQFGNMLLSRWPIVASRNHLLPKYASLGPMSMQRAALETTIEVAGTTALRCYSVHLTHVSAETRLPQVERLLEIDRDAALEGPLYNLSRQDGWALDRSPPAVPEGAVILGDFNARPDSLEYQRMTGPWSPFGGRVSNPTGFVDALAWLHGEGCRCTTAEIRGEPVRLDYVFVRSTLAPGLGRGWVDREATGSDHQPVWVELEL